RRVRFRSGDAEVMAREADGLHAGSVGLAQAGDFLQTDVLERDGITRSAAVDHEIAAALPAIEEGEDLLLLGAGGHAEGDVDLAGKAVTQVFEHRPVLVARRGDLDEGRVEGNDLARGGEVPDGRGVGRAEAFAELLQAAVLVRGELEGLAVRA